MCECVSVPLLDMLSPLMTNTYVKVQTRKDNIRTVLSILNSSVTEHGGGKLLKHNSKNRTEDF